MNIYQNVCDAKFHSVTQLNMAMIIQMFCNFRNLADWLVLRITPMFILCEWNMIPRLSLREKTDS